MFILHVGTIAKTTNVKHQRLRSCEVDQFYTFIPPCLLGLYWHFIHNFSFLLPGTSKTCFRDRASKPVEELLALHLVWLENPLLQWVINSVQTFLLHTFKWYKGLATVKCSIHLVISLVTNSRCVLSYKGHPFVKLQIYSFYVAMDLQREFYVSFCDNCSPA